MQIARLGFVFYAGAFAGLGLLCQACGGGGGTCGEPTDAPIDADSYTSTGGRSESTGRTFPHGTSPSVLTVDREAGVVRIAFERNGVEVVEVWRIKQTGGL